MFLITFNLKRKYVIVAINLRLMELINFQIIISGILGIVAWVKKNKCAVSIVILIYDEANLSTCTSISTDTGSDTNTATTRQKLPLRSPNYRAKI